MFGEARIEHPFQGEATRAVTVQAFGRKVKAVAGAIGNVLAAIAEPFRRPGYLELLDPKVRAGMTGQEKGVIDAYFHGV